ncbi:MAG: alpha/beta hydrolase [Rhizomicrobium sp.]
MNERPGELTGPQEWLLWPSDPPGTPDNLDTDQITISPAAADELGTYEHVGRPSMFVFQSAKPTGAAALMFPGGGYVHVAMGGGIPRALNAAGITVFELKYRLPSGRWAAGLDAVLQDGQRAMRLIRANAARYSIDPSKLAVLGFSAGGHGAATLVARSSAQVYEAVDDADTQNARPNLAGLMFPVIALDRSFAHLVSREKLLGPNAPADVAARYSPDLHVTADSPPTFLAHAYDDPVVPVENSIAMFKALRAAHVPAQLHVFDKGGHGIKLPGTPNKAWMDLFLSWSNQHGFPTLA